ncbi:MAG: hypothetical protein QXO51_04990 [Halobacteria archaeon]
MAIDPLVLKTLGVDIGLGGLVLAFTHLARRRLPAIPSLAVGLAGAPLAMLLLVYRGDALAWNAETFRVWALLLAEVPSGVWVAGAILAGGLVAAYLLSGRVPHQVYRSFVHLTSGSAGLALLLLSPSLFILAFGVVIALLMVAEYLRRLDDPNPVTTFLRRIMNPAMRGEEAEGLLAPLFFLSAALVVALMVPPLVAAVSIAVLTYADPAAALVGRLIGKRHWSHNPQKTKEGSIAFVLAAFYSVLLLNLFFPEEERIHPLLALMVAMSAALFESLPLRIGDNLILPTISAMVLVSGADAPLLNPSPQFWFVIMPILLGAAGAAYLTRFLDGLGAGAAVFFGALVYQASGPSFFLALLLFFGFAVALRGTEMKRSASSIVANGAVPAFAAVLYPASPAFATLLFAGSIATAAADTASGRIASRSIATRAGAALAGSAVTGLLLLGLFNPSGMGLPAFTASMVGGFGGWLVVRATSRLKFLSKEESNLFGTMIGAAAAIALRL